MVALKILPRPLDVEGLEEGGGATLLDGTLAEAVQRAGATFSGGRGTEALFVEDGVALGPDALAAALAAGRAFGGPCRFALGGAIGELLAQLPGAGPTLAYAPDGGDDGAGLLAQAPWVEIPPEERLLPVDLPGGGEGIPLSDRLILPVRHWLDLLWANLLGLPPFLWGALLSRSLPLAALRVTGAALRARSLQPERVAARLVQRGPGARVHPSATVEASALGPGARVGPGAIVRGCILGPGARVEAQALCEGVVLGPGAVAQRQAMVKYSVLGGGAMIGGVTQLSVLGRGSSLKAGAYGMDQSLEGRVRVRRGAELVDAPLGLAGTCLGEDVLIGCGVRVAPGRAVPARARVVADGALTRPEEIEPEQGPYLLGGE